MLEKINISEVIDYFPQLIHNKIEQLEIRTLQELRDIEDSKLESIKGLGVKSKGFFNLIKTELSTSPEIIIDFWEEKNRTHKLPENSDSLIGFTLLKNTISQFFQLLSNDKLYPIFNLYFGFDQSKIYSLEEISMYLGLSRERVRQLYHDGLEKLIEFLNIGESMGGKMILSSQAKEYFDGLKSIVTANSIHSIKSINEELELNGLIFNPLTTKQIELVAAIFKLKECGKVETIFTESTIYVDSGLSKKDVIKTAKALINHLDQSILSQTLIDTIIGVRKAFKKSTVIIIERLSDILNETEVFENESSKQIQLKFGSLSNARDRVYRILHEEGNPLYIDDIVSIVNRKMIENGKLRTYTRHSLALASDDRFKSKQKTGYWDLSAWETNTETIEELVKKALILLDKPSTYEEIILKIHDERPNLKEKSIRALVGKHCVKVDTDKFILPEWRNKYNQLALAKRTIRINTKEFDKTKRFRDDIINHLLIQPNKTILAKDLVKEMVNKGSGHNRPRVYKLLNDTTVFKKAKSSNGRIEISLVQNDTNERIDIDDLNWRKVKRIIIREVENKIIDPRQPVYGTSMADCLELLKELLDWQSPDPLLNGLGERIIPSIEKYYSNPDRTDRLNILKQLVTSLDPFLKKVLYCVNQVDYNWIKTNRKGLGDVIGKLVKIDPRNDRFKPNERSCNVNRWGKEINRAYKNRNLDTHNAKDFSDSQINDIVSACIIIMIYATYEYENEIKNGI